MEHLSRHFIIAGASSGIGLSMARELLAGGHQVTGLSRTPGELAGTQGYTHAFHDFLSQDPLPPIDKPSDGIAYCPGSITLKPLARLSRSDVQGDFELNAVGAFEFVRKYLENMKDARPGAVLLFSSVAASTGLPYHVSIAMAKGAVEGLVKALAAELAPGIRVNAIAPSLTDTPLARQLLNSESKMAANSERHPLKTIGRAEDLAALGCQLLTGSPWMTGQVIPVNGGLGTIIR
ncbi:SDR family oxidoreductase [uncultured Flavobacterium sp.]|uniref:SDR family NAD(P)-dependent oxidoreductase n=1 Tax=uncultured Flavobacterium sp. TaxID=165435 RepID=UPI0025D58E07|nr:SDR family oxidoreductase [uncultured Flavobacterium sp.]